LINDYTQNSIEDDNFSDIASNGRASGLGSQRDLNETMLDKIDGVNSKDLNSE
jgi:hypothetical protein